MAHLIPRLLLISWFLALASAFFCLASSVSGSESLTPLVATGTLMKPPCIGLADSLEQFAQILVSPQSRGNLLTQFIGNVDRLRFASYAHGQSPALMKLAFGTLAAWRAAAPRIADQGAPIDWLAASENLGGLETSPLSCRAVVYGLGHNRYQYLIVKPL